MLANTQTDVDRRRRIFTCLLPVLLASSANSNSANAADYVIHISVDGLNSSVLQAVIDAGEAPNFKRFEDEGAWTSNARADYTFTTTLPDHTTIITGRPVLEPEGMPGAPFHHWTSNTVPRRGMTLHQNGYIASVFDVVHDAGRSTAMFASKDKFVIFDQSYDETHGAPHAHGRDKIDFFFVQDDGPPQYSQTMNERFISEMGARHFNYVFVHYRDPDSIGHVLGWDSNTYRFAIKSVDGYLAQVFHLVDNDPQLEGKTAIILTSDHGGTRFGHSNPQLRANFTVPVMVWGAESSPAICTRSMPTPAAIRARSARITPSNHNRSATAIPATWRCRCSASVRFQLRSSTRSRICVSHCRAITTWTGQSTPTTRFCGGRPRDPQPICAPMAITTAASTRPITMCGEPILGKLRSGCASIARPRQIGSS